MDLSPFSSRSATEDATKSKSESNPQDGPEALGAQAFNQSQSSKPVEERQASDLSPSIAISNQASDNPIFSRPNASTPRTDIESSREVAVPSTEMTEEDQIQKAIDESLKEQERKEEADLKQE